MNADTVNIHFNRELSLLGESLENVRISNIFYQIISLCHSVSQ